MSFSIGKVEQIRTKVASDTSVSIYTMPCQYLSDPCINKMPNFNPLTTSDVEKLSRQFPNKSCSLDTLPTWLIKSCVPSLLPIITKIINTSLLYGVFPETFKQSIIIPVLKKPTLDSNVLKSYRLISNIKFIGKVIEKAASCQVTSHVNNNNNNIGDKFQSAYKTHHSTETALLKVKNDILQSLDKNKVVLLVLLDMSVAFDTIDHGIFLDRIETRFGITGTAKSWYMSYLNERHTRVSIGNAQSVEHVLRFSVPQGSVLGPQCFTMYTHPVGNIIREHNVSFHVYADDIQLYAESDPKVTGDSNRALTNLSTCISKINTWMVQNRLQLNQNKTEFAWARGIFSSAHLLRSLHWLPVKERIMFKIILFVYTFFQRQSPSYISENLTMYNTDGPGGRRGLRSSSDVTRLVAPRSKGKAGDSSFFVAVPKLWNKLPGAIGEAASTATFKSQLKTHLFPSL